MTDQAREIAARLGKAQRATILSLGEDWGPAHSHQCAKRMFYGIRDGHCSLILPSGVNQRLTPSENIDRVTSATICLG